MNNPESFPVLFIEPARINQLGEHWGFDVSNLFKSLYYHVNGINPLPSNERVDTLGSDISLLGRFVWGAISKYDYIISPKDKLPGIQLMQELLTHINHDASTQCLLYLERVNDWLLDIHDPKDGPQRLGSPSFLVSAVED